MVWFFGWVFFAGFEGVFSDFGVGLSAKRSDGVSVEKRFLRLAQNDDAIELQLNSRTPSGLTSQLARPAICRFRGGHERDEFLCRLGIGRGLGVGDSPVPWFGVTRTMLKVRVARHVGVGALTVAYG